MKPYLDAYNNYLNSSLPGTQQQSASPPAPLSEDELIGRYFNEAWEREDYFSPL